MEIPWNCLNSFLSVWDRWWMYVSSTYFIIYALRSEERYKSGESSWKHLLFVNFINPSHYVTKTCLFARSQFTSLYSLAYEIIYLYFRGLLCNFYQSDDGQFYKTMSQMLCIFLFIYYRSWKNHWPQAEFNKQYN